MFKNLFVFVCVFLFVFALKQEPAKTQQVNGKSSISKAVAPRDGGAPFSATSSTSVNAGGVRREAEWEGIGGKRGGGDGGGKVVGGSSAVASSKKVKR